MNRRYPVALPDLLPDGPGLRRWHHRVLRRRGIVMRALHEVDSSPRGYRGTFVRIHNDAIAFESREGQEDVGKHARHDFGINTVASERFIGRGKSKYNELANCHRFLPLIHPYHLLLFRQGPPFQSESVRKLRLNQH